MHILYFLEKLDKPVILLFIGGRWKLSLYKSLIDFNYINFGSQNKEENHIELLFDLEDTEEDEIKIGSTVKEQSEN